MNKKQIFRKISKITAPVVAGEPETNTTDSEITEMQSESDTTDTETSEIQSGSDDDSNTSDKINSSDNNKFSKNRSASENSSTSENSSASENKSTSENSSASANTISSESGRLDLSFSISSNGVSVPGRLTAGNSYDIEMTGTLPEGYSVEYTPSDTGISLTENEDGTAVISIPVSTKNSSLEIVIKSKDALGSVKYRDTIRRDVTIDDVKGVFSAETFFSHINKQKYSDNEIESAVNLILFGSDCSTSDKTGKDSVYKNIFEIPVDLRYQCFYEISEEAQCYPGTTNQKINMITEYNKATGNILVSEGDN